eukprot:CAMPEP_0172864002 /NCGR_PEP_ID=MMETSP1075-20121228/79041_1 /TAXON_ID=2916 /ORGANISM="Ceratium fusus, Strain PA161109" /LENGTH=161 /DNA_ID=CAMNT_0013712771 /DNA_START=68 /DNA_END=550 /DNA_ORIENTATION=+
MAPGRREETQLLETSVEDSESIVQPRSRAWAFGRALVGLPLLVSLVAVSFLLGARSGRIIRSVRPSASTEEVAILAGCCTYFTDPNNKCGTCGANNLQTSGFCSVSKGNCETCGTTSVWCGGESSSAKQSSGGEAISHKPKQVGIMQPAGTALKNPFKGKN